MDVISPGWYVLVALAVSVAALSPLLLPPRHRVVASLLAITAVSTFAVTLWLHNELFAAALYTARIPLFAGLFVALVTFVLLSKKQRMIRATVIAAILAASGLLLGPMTPGNNHGNAFLYSLGFIAAFLVCGSILVFAKGQRTAFVGVLSAVLCALVGALWVRDLNRSESQGYSFVTRRDPAIHRQVAYQFVPTSRDGGIGLLFMKRVNTAIPPDANAIYERFIRQFPKQRERFEKARDEAIAREAVEARIEKTRALSYVYWECREDQPYYWPDLTVGMKPAGSFNVSTSGFQLRLNNEPEMPNASVDRHYWGIMIPNWFVMSLLTMVAWLSLKRAFGKESVFHRRRNQLCLTCGYSLLALPPPVRCPECGTVATHVAPNTMAAQVVSQPAWARPVGEEERREIVERLTKTAKSDHVESVADSSR